MSDPFIHLRGETSRTPPPIDAIRSRAGRIERRKHLVLGGGGGIIALVALSALFAGGLPGGRESRDLADALRLSPAPEIVAGTASPPTVGEASGEARLAAPDAGTATSGGRSEATLSAPQSRSSAEGASDAAAVANQSGASPLDVTLEVDDQSLLGRRIEFTLSACNNGSDTVEQTFASGQRYNFEVSRDGDLVWRWSDGQVFTQEFGTEAWAPGECKTYSEIWNGRDTDNALVEAGTYQAEGILSSDPPLRTGRQDFCVESC